MQPCPRASSLVAVARLPPSWYHGRWGCVESAFAGNVMGDVSMHWWKAGLSLLRALVVGLLGGVGMTFLVLFALQLYDETFDTSPPRGGRRPP